MRVYSPMYRGARMGDPKRLSGPSYFISSESFARTYGPTAAFEVTVKKPYFVTNLIEWYNYASDSQHPTTGIAKQLKRDGYDSVVHVREAPNGEELTIILLVDSRQARVLQ